MWVCVCVCEIKAMSRSWQHQEIPGDVFNKARQQQRQQPEDQQMKTCWSGALRQKSEAANGCRLFAFKSGDAYFASWMMGEKRQRIFCNVPKLNNVPNVHIFPFAAFICSIYPEGNSTHPSAHTTLKSLSVSITNTVEVNPTWMGKFKCANVVVFFCWMDL